MSSNDEAKLQLLPMHFVNIQKTFSNFWAKNEQCYEWEKTGKNKLNLEWAEKSAEH